jgi:hypothetical protein
MKNVERYLCLRAAAAALLGLVFTFPALSQETAPASRRVLVLTPVVAFETLPGGMGRRRALDEEAYQTRLMSRASAAAKDAGLAVLEESGDPAPLSEDDLRPVRLEVSRLARGVVVDAARGPLARISAGCADCLVMVLYLKGKVGPGGSWNPNTGAITSHMDSLLVEAALLDPGAARAVWKNEVYLRDLPPPSHDKLLKVLTTLFANFKSE